jgi:hypothetical protein
MESVYGEFSHSLGHKRSVASGCLAPAPGSARHDRCTLLAVALEFMLDSV